MVMKLQVEPAEKQEGQGEDDPVPSTSGAGPSGFGPDSGNSAPFSVSQSLVTSKGDENNEDEETSGRRSDGNEGLRLVRKDFRCIFAP